MYARIGVKGIRQPQSAKEVSGFARKYSRKTFEGRSKKAERHGIKIRITRYEWSA